jgi:hypothetical protein
VLRGRFTDISRATLFCCEREQAHLVLRALMRDQTALGIEGPVMSQSEMPLWYCLRRSNTASIEVTRLLPTRPCATSPITFLMRLMGWGLRESSPVLCASLTGHEQFFVHSSQLGYKIAHDTYAPKFDGLFSNSGWGGSAHRGDHHRGD